MSATGSYDEEKDKLYCYLVNANTEEYLKCLGKSPKNEKMDWQNYIGDWQYAVFNN